jgi:hypothetical protein
MNHPRTHRETHADRQHETNHSSTIDTARVTAWGEVSSAETSLPAQERPRSRDTRGVSIVVSCVEVHGQQCIDLLGFQNSQVRVLEDTRGNVSLSGVQTLSPSTPQELLDIVKLALSQRREAQTTTHNHSSRSHLVCCIVVRSKDTDGRLVLVDLAGSERRSDSASHDRARLYESSLINTGLMALKQCMCAFARNQRIAKSTQMRIPYRQHTITRLLKASFTHWDARTVVIGTVSPASADTEHTIDTLAHLQLLAECTYTVGGGSGANVAVNRRSNNGGDQAVAVRSKSPGIGRHGARAAPKPRDMDAAQAGRRDGNVELGAQARTKVKGQVGNALFARENKQKLRRKSEMPRRRAVREPALTRQRRVGVTSHLCTARAGATLTTSQGLKEGGKKKQQHSKRGLKAQTTKASSTIALSLSGGRTTDRTVTSRPSKPTPLPSPSSVSSSFKSPKLQAGLLTNTSRVRHHTRTGNTKTRTTNQVTRSRLTSSGPTTQTRAGKQGLTVGRSSVATKRVANGRKGPPQATGGKSRNARHNKQVSVSRSSNAPPCSPESRKGERRRSTLGADVLIGMSPGP